MSNILEVNDKNFAEEVIQSNMPVVVDFWASWCGPCRILAPVVEELSQEYTGKIKIVKMNTDENPSTPSKYMIISIPTLIFFKNGKPVDQLVGIQSKNEIKKHLDRLL
ncbi:MAG TPA: thioredoxin [Elusimicrobia bacterium]|jgi:thioredoxin 1|nr:thioredoxin [Elusimicrobiota bacterium]